MDKSFFQFAYSGWWIFVVLLVAAGLTFWLYSSAKRPWSKTQNSILAALRFLGITAILLLLLSPSIRKVTNTVKKPVVALAIDNSESIALRGPKPSEIIDKIDKLEEGLIENGLDVVRMTMQDTLAFQAPITNLSELLSKAEKETADENLAAVVLMTDGIYNRGSSPLYRNYLYPVFTIGLGDTIPPRDISISRTLYNKVTYKGNETPVRLEIRQNGYENERVNIRLLESGKPIAQQSIVLKNTLQEVNFVIKSEKEGLRHLIAIVTNKTDESSIKNNQADIFMEVIDGRQNILIVAHAPHPDIRAIRSTLEATGNYETHLYLPSIHKEKPSETYDAIIFHGAFSSGTSYTPKGTPGIWYILSNESSITSANKTIPYLQIERRGARPDRVSGSFNQNFSKFKIEEVSAFESYPPIEVPFGNYSLSGPVEILMYQKIGSVITQKPLMAVYDDGTQKSAVLMGQNIWKWKLQEAAIHGEAAQFENLISKTIQFLSVKNTKKQFRFEPQKRSFRDTEPPQFEVEVYNDIYERIYENNIKVTITSETGQTQNYTFNDTEYNTTFRSPVLPPGLYRYQAQVQVGNKTLTERGEFLVQKINPEALDLTADHRLLKNLSVKTGGVFVSLSETEALIDTLKNRGFKSVIQSDEQIVPLYETWWWYLVIFLLFSAEWFLRKYWGGY